MSFQAMAWAVRLDLPSREKLTILMVANYADERGKAWPSNATLARDTGMTRKTVIASLKALAERGLLTINPRSIDGSNLSNVYVLNLQNNGGEGGVTDTPVGEEEHEGVVTELHHPSVAATHKPIIEPIKEEIEVAPLSSIQKKKATEGKAGSRLAPDWQPSEADQKFATELGVPWNSEAEKFRDYWSAQAGAKGRKADWTATWRNWIRRAAERRTSWTPITASVSPPPKVKPPKEDFCDQVRQQFYEDTIGHRYAQFLRGYWNEKEWGPSPLTNPLESELNPEVQKEMAEIFDRMDLMAALRRARWQQGFDMETWVDREENENVRRV